MEQIGERAILFYVPLTDLEMPFGGLNILTVFNSVVVMMTVWTLMWLGARRFAKVPSRGQVLVELFVGAFDALVSSSLEFETRKKNRAFLPLIASLFAFLVLSNFMGFVPYEGFEEPTADLNCTLALGFMAVAIATYCGVKAKGAWGYFSELLGPLWSQEDVKGVELVMGKLSALFFFPLNVIGEMAKVVSISFRLFGNILGGGIIIVVVSHLVYYTFLPVGLQFFFIFFVGAVQAFVFTMLTLTYISVAIK